MVDRFRLGIVSAVLASACADSSGAVEKVRTLKVSVTAYCLEGKTASGLKARTGIAAADPDVLPIGSVIRLRATSGKTKHAGVYTILDTGGDIQGRRVDIHIPSCAEARRFGRRPMVAEVLRRGWTPDESRDFYHPRHANDNVRRDSTYGRGRQDGEDRAAGRDSRHSADAASAARR